MRPAIDFLDPGQAEMYHPGKDAARARFYGPPPPRVASKLLQFFFQVFAYFFLFFFFPSINLTIFLYCFSSLLFPFLFLSTLASITRVSSGIRPWEKGAKLGIASQAESAHAVAFQICTRNAGALLDEAMDLTNYRWWVGCRGVTAEGPLPLRAITGQRYLIRLPRGIVLHAHP